MLCVSHLDINYADLEEKVSSLENEIKEYQEREVATAAESKVIHTVHGI